jgi:predicted SAM-dependent methyltransferase
MALINDYANARQLNKIKLNLGCGGRPLKGWINIDFFDYENNDSSRSGSVYDIKMDISVLDVEDNTVDEILLVHVVEHFTRWSVQAMFKHYLSKLKIGGRVVVEMPDLDRCINLYLAGKSAPHMNTPLGPINMGRSQFYGNQWDQLDYETHRYVWTMQEFTSELESIGFKIISSSYDAVFHMKGRDMFVVAERQ